MFSHDKTGVVGFGKEEHIPSPKCLITSRVHDLVTVDINCVPLAEVVFLKFFHCKISFIPLFMLCFLEGSHCAQSTSN